MTSGMEERLNATVLIDAVMIKAELLILFGDCVWQELLDCVGRRFGGHEVLVSIRMYLGALLIAT